MWALLLVGAHAADPILRKHPSFRLEPTEGADLEVLQTARPGVSEVLIRGNRADLRAQLKGVKVTGIRAMQASDLGGAWLVVAAFTEEDSRLEFSREDGGWVGRVVAGAPGAVPPTEGVVSIADLLGGQVVDVPCATAPLPLVPLRGTDLSFAIEPREYVPELPRWTRAEPEEVSWAEVDAWRTKQWTARSARETAIAWYRTGALYRELGHARESAYYFGGAMESGGGGFEVPLQRAASFLAIGRWERAREAAETAWHLGAPDGAVLEVLAVAALATGDPASASLARALGHTTARAEPRLLAGALLLREGCPSDAAPLLASAVGRLPERYAVPAQFLLVDALLGAGQVDEAAISLSLPATTTRAGEWVGLARARSRLISLLRDAPDKWPEMVPSLEHAGHAFDWEGDESLFLAGQVHERLGEDRLAIEAWTRLAHRKRGVVGGARERLRVAVLGRLGRLLAQGDDIGAMSLYQAAWRSEFLAEMSDPTILRSLADCFDRIGLPLAALEILQDVSAMEGRDGRDDRATVVSIAGLYLKLGRVREAQESVDFLRASRAIDESLQGQIVMLEAHIARAAGDTARARQRLEVAAGFPGLEAQATAERVLLDAESGRCDLALPGFEAALAVPGYDQAANHALHAVCLGGAGLEPAAGIAARVASHGAADSELAAWTGSMARRFGVGEPIPPDSPGNASVWARVDSEEAVHAEFASAWSGRIPAVR